MVSYFNDIFLTGSEQLAKELCKSLWEYLVGPVVLWPLLDVPNSLTPKSVPFYTPTRATNEKEQLEAFNGADNDLQV